MAVDYTKIFTVMGSYIDKINDYQTYIGIFTEDKADIDSLLGGQDLVRLGDGLTEDYDDFKSDVSSWTNTLISRVTTLLTDEDLIGSNFPFGTGASLDLVWPALIHDMVENDINVDSSTSTVGLIEYDTVNDPVGVLNVGTLLDGITPPVDGGQAIKEYSGLSTQMTPEDETLTFTCRSDSENGAIRGSESFDITGTLASSDPFSPGGENIGQLGSIQLADGNASQYLVNPSFDSWTTGTPDGWTIGSGVAGDDFEQGSSFQPDFSGVKYSIKTIQDDGLFDISQDLSTTTFQRGKSYFVSVWAAKDTDIAGDQALAIQIRDVSTIYLTLAIQPSDTAFANFVGQFVMPEQLAGDFKLNLYTGSTLDAANDAVIVDQIVITPCEYHSGVAIAIFDGPYKFLIGDTISLHLSNDGLGLFQSFIRKAYKIQIPSDDTPTISEDLIV